LSARRSFGTESVAPDIAYLEGKRANQYQLSTVESECVKRICDRADPEQLFEVVSGCPYEAAQTLTSHILLLDPLPIKAAAVAIESSKAVSVTLAAQVIGRNADKKHSSSVGASLDRWLETYSKTSEELRLQNEQGDVDFVREREAIQKLVWAAGRVGGLEKNLLNIVTTQSSGEHFGDLRVAAMESLKSGKISAALKKQIKLLHADYDSRIRLSATEILASEMTKTEMDALAETVLADRHCYNVLTREPKADLTKTFQTAAESAHYQPRSIPQLTKAHDVKTLLKIASNSKSELNVRLGAIEGLAAMDHKDAEKNLVTIGKDESIDEDLRKAAWRGLRRWKRRTLKQAARPGKAGQK